MHCPRLLIDDVTNVQFTNQKVFVRLAPSLLYFVPLKARLCSIEEVKS